MSCSKPVTVRIVDVETCGKGFPLAVGDVRCALNAKTRQIVFYAADAADGEVPVTIENVFVMNSKPGWTLSLDLRGLGVPSAILLAMCLWVLPMDTFVGELSTAGVKALLWVGLSMPLLLRRGRQQLAIELTDDAGVIILETRDANATAQFLNI